MAKKKKTNTPQPQLRTYSAPEISQYVMMSPLGQIVGDWDTDRLDANTCRYMLEHDETVASGLEFFTYTVLNMIGEYNHPDPKIRSFVNNVLGDKFKNAIRDALTDGITFGFHTSEIIWNSKNGKVVIDRFVNLPPEQVRFITNAKATRVIAVEQVPINNGPVRIPLNKCFVYTHGSTSNPYGKSSFRRIYRPYRFKESVIKFWAIALEKFGMPIVIGKSSDADSLINNLREMYSSAGIAISPEDEVSILESKRDIGRVFDEAVTWADRMIYRGLLLPQLLVTAGNAGSYALGQVHLNMFLTTAKWIAQEVLNSFINDVIIPLINYNFGSVDNYGSFMLSSQPSAQERSQLATMFYNLVNAGILDPVKDGKMIREMLKLPEGGN